MPGGFFPLSQLIQPPRRPLWNRERQTAEDERPAESNCEVSDFEHVA